MLLLAIVVAPLGFAALFLVMSSAERALDHKLECRVPPTTSLGGGLGDGWSTAEPFVLIDQVAER